MIKILTVNVMKLKKSISSTIVAVALVCAIAFGIVPATACVSSNGNGQQQIIIHQLILELNGGNLRAGENITSFKEGEEVILPQPQKFGYIFIGWFDNEDCEGNAYTRISAEEATADKKFWAKWEKESTPKPQTYSVELHLNGGKLAEGEDVTSYTTGISVNLPTPSRDGYIFIGWYDNELFEGSAVTQISQSATGDKQFYAKWNIDEEPKVEFVTITLNLGEGKTDIITVERGKAAQMPDEPTRAGYAFVGWFTESDEEYDFTKAVTESMNLYAKWAATANDIEVIDFGGYEEGAYVKWALLNGTTVEDYVVCYKKSNGVSNWTVIDNQLIRADGEYLRADVLGLSAGSYDIKISATGGKLSIIENVVISAYDRSGYAHFNNTVGVGAYNNNGTIKNDALIVYVSEATKNTVQATIGGAQYTGIANILANADKLNGRPLIVRIVGTIGAATWNEINYDKGGNFNDGTDYSSDNLLPLSKVIGVNGKQLPTDKKDITQQELIDGGYNTLNTSVYSELIGLNSKAKWDGTEFDSAWNNCSITGAKNVTVEGIGTDARLFQWGFTWIKCNSIEVRNLTFEDYTEDACSFEGGVDSTTVNGFDSNNIWVHHNTFLEGKNYWDVCAEQDKHEGDGATDFKRNAYVTISYNHYIENHKTGLVGGGNSQMSACFTFHHNWYERCVSRLPLARQANMHMYNNLYDGTTGTNMSLRANAYALIENCYFRNANNPITTDGGYAKVVNCTFEGCSIGSTYINNKTVVQTSRTAHVNNSNVYGQDFDTDPNLFYYNVEEERSAISPRHGRNDVVTVVPELAGVHKK